MSNNTYNPSLPIGTSGLAMTASDQIAEMLSQRAAGFSQDIALYQPVRVNLFPGAFNPKSRNFRPELDDTGATRRYAAIA
jgi:hypothetical protein